MSSKLERLGFLTVVDVGHANSAVFFSAATCQKVAGPAGSRGPEQAADVILFTRLNVILCAARSVQMLMVMVRDLPRETLERAAAEDRLNGWLSGYVADRPVAELSVDEAAARPLAAGRVGTSPAPGWHGWCRYTVTLRPRH
jgi:predicted component of type VI protein secretion system